MSETTQSNKRIAKNTLFLYFRQILTMAVSLYTVRVILDVLGTEDYGIYNVVGGIVIMFSFLSGTMASSTQRFLSFELGKGGEESVKKVFSLSVMSYVFILLIVLVLAETIGLWFLNNKMTIPESRLFAANCVYQCSIISFIATLLGTSYNASIIAMERMDVFAYASIADVVLKLAMAFVLPIVNQVDSLILYGILITLCIIVIQVFYAIYCRSRFSFCKFKYSNDFKLFREMLSFAGWNMFGSIANILRSQGLNILINMFFNPTVNAARGIAFQVNSALTNFTTNFYTAVRPQLVKLYSTNQREAMLDLGFQSSRLAYYLMLLIATPLLCETSGILQLWLKEVPNYTVLFLRITIVASLIEVFALPLVNMLQAAGKIKLYQGVVSIVYLLNIPISYMLLSFGYNAEHTMYVNAGLVAISIIPRLFICKKIIGLNINTYLRCVIGRVLVPTIIVVIWVYCYSVDDLFSYHLFAKISIHLLIATVCILLLGLTRKEKMQIIEFLKQKI